MDATNKVLLIGNSVRYLAQSGHANGVRVFGGDLFGDVDACQASDTLVRADVFAANDELDARLMALLDAGTPWVYTAGFETCPDRLAIFQRRNGALLGNGPDVLRLLANTRAWFRLLDTLAIAVPPVRFTPPMQGRGWLYKPGGRYGGFGIRQAAGGASPATPDGFYQQFVKGPLYSLVFAADGRDVVPVGFNRLLARNPGAGDFRFSDVVSMTAVDSGARETMLGVAARLTRELGLRGINGVDFVLQDGRPLLLDLNARPPASLELYESALVDGGLRCHVEACGGMLPSPVDRVGCRGLRVVYARDRLRLGRIDWPEMVRDRPQPGSVILRDEPLCTVHVDGPETESVMAGLREATDVVFDLVSPFAEAVA